MCSIVRATQRVYLDSPIVGTNQPPSLGVLSHTPTSPSPTPPPIFLFLYFCFIDRDPDPLHPGTFFHCTSFNRPPPPPLPHALPRPLRWATYGRICPLVNICNIYSNTLLCSAQLLLHVSLFNCSSLIRYTNDREMKAWICDNFP